MDKEEKENLKESIFIESIKKRKYQKRAVGLRKNKL